MKLSRSGVFIAEKFYFTDLFFSMHKRLFLLPCFFLGGGNGSELWLCFSENFPISSELLSIGIIVTTFSALIAQSHLFKIFFVILDVRWANLISICQLFFPLGSASIGHQKDCTAVGSLLCSDYEHALCFLFL